MKRVGGGLRFRDTPAPLHGFPGCQPPCSMLSVDQIEFNSASTEGVKVLVAQSCLTLFDPIDCSPPGFSVHGLIQARTLEWVAIPFSRGSSQPGDGTQVSRIVCRFFIL